MTVKRVFLTPPLLSDKHIKEKLVCIRAHRERIFQVIAQMQGDKFVIHNYGQGGAGWTFLFGCVQEAIRKFEQHLVYNSSYRNKPVCVIGAGCYGLLTAVMLARKGYQVRIVAKEADNLPSYKAAGFFFPRPRKSSSPDERARFLACGMESYATYLQIAQGTHSFIAKGVKLLPAYFGLDIDPGFAPYIEKGLMHPSEQVVIDFGNGKSYQAREYTTIFIESFVLMAELRREITELGISITQAEVTSLQEITESMIFNCAGSGAQHLAGDPRVVPVQGHLITLQNQPDLSLLQYLINVKVVMPNLKGMPRDELIYFAPKESGILGITFIRGQDCPMANQHEFDRILMRCREYFGT